MRSYIFAIPHPGPVPRAPRVLRRARGCPPGRGAPRPGGVARSATSYPPHSRRSRARRRRAAGHDRRVLRLRLPAVRPRLAGPRPPARGLRRRPPGRVPQPDRARLRRRRARGRGRVRGRGPGPVLADAPPAVRREPAASTARPSRPTPRRSARRAALPRRPRPRGLQRPAGPAPPRGRRARDLLRPGRPGQRPTRRRLPRRASLARPHRRGDPRRPGQACARAPRGDLYAAFQAGALLAPIELEPEAAEAARQQLAGRFAVDIKTLPADFQRAEAGKRYMVEAGDAPALGPVDAPVQLVAFMDFECPFCRRAAQEGFTELRRRYPEDLRWLSPPARSRSTAPRTAPPGPRSRPTARASSGRSPTSLLADETSLGRGDLPRDRPRLGLDEARFLADLDGRRPPPPSARTCSSRVGSASTPRRRSSSTAAAQTAFATSRRSSPRSTPSSRPPELIKPARRAPTLLGHPAGPGPAPGPIPER
jgi:hypothetical protein